MASTRQQRVQHLLIEEVSDIVRRDVKDPRIGFVTITGAEVSPDLGHARVYVSFMGTEQQRKDGLQGLRSAARFIRREFGRRADLRVTPEIEFCLDTAIEQGARIFDLLEQIKREEPVEADGSPVAPDTETTETTAREDSQPDGAQSH